MFRKIIMLISKTESKAKKYLEKNENVSLVLVEDCRQALRKIHSTMPELLMVEIDEEKAVELYFMAVIKEHKDLKEMPIIFLGKNMEEITKETKELSNTHYIKEPYTEKDINSTINRALKIVAD